VGACHGVDISRHKSTDVDLQRRLPVAEEVERRGEAWIDILPAGHALDLVVVTRRHEGAGGEVLCGNERIEVVVTESDVERQSLQRPLILGVYAQIDLQTLAERHWLRI